MALRDRTDTAFPLIHEGMPQTSVVRLLGKPSEVRTNRFPSGSPEAYAFAYKVRCHGGFALGGIVSFDINHKVLEASHPVLSYGIRRGAEILPSCLDVPHPVSNILCVIDAVKSDAREPDYLLRQQVHFSLINQSPKPTAVPTPLHSLGLCIALEVYDADKHLIFRKDNGTRGPISSPGPSGYPSLGIAPYSSVGGEDCIWLSRSDYGKPDPGTYYVRVAFGFDPAARAGDQFSVSKAFKFEVPNTPQ